MVTISRFSWVTKRSLLSRRRSLSDNSSFFLLRRLFLSKRGRNWDSASRRRFNYRTRKTKTKTQYRNLYTHNTILKNIYNKKWNKDMKHSMLHIKELVLWWVCLCQCVCVLPVRCVLLTEVHFDPPAFWRQRWAQQFLTETCGCPGPPETAHIRTSTHTHTNTLLCSHSVMFLFQKNLTKKEQ